MANITLSWNAAPASDNVTAFQIWGANGTGTAFGSCTLLATVSGLTWTDTGLPNNQARTYYIVAVNQIGSSSPEGPINVTTAAPASTYVQNAGGATTIQEGTHAARPAAGNAGAIYVETDTGSIFRDDGSAWFQIGGGALTVEDEGSSLGSAATMNFTGAGVTASVSGGVATVNISGGGGGGAAAALFTDLLAVPPNNLSSDSDATMGNRVTAAADAVIHGLIVSIGAQVGDTREPIIYEIDGSTGAFIAEIGVGPAKTDAAAYSGFSYYPFSAPVTLTTGTHYMIGLRRTDGSGTSSCRLNFYNGANVYQTAKLTPVGVCLFAKTGTPSVGDLPSILLTQAIIWSVGILVEL